MDTYLPTARRPIAAMFRRTADWPVKWCVRCNVHPDWVSYASVIVSALAGICFWQASRWQLLLILGPLLCYVRLWLNMLDGMVAIAANLASKRGEILNDLPDRLSDAMIFGGLAESGYCHPSVAYWTAIFALLTAYVGTLGQAVGGRREYAGLMSKPWRMVALQFGSFFTFTTMRSWHLSPWPWNLKILDWTCLLIIVGCLQTIALRLVRILRTLDLQRLDAS